MTIVATGFSGTQNFQKTTTASLSNLFNAPAEKKTDHGQAFEKEERQLEKLEREEFRRVRQKPEPAKKDIWDIPAFMRKKKK